MKLPASKVPINPRAKSGQMSSQASCFFSSGTDQCVETLVLSAPRNLPVNSPGVQQIITSEMNRREVRIAEKIKSISTVCRWLSRLHPSSSEQPNHDRRVCVNSVIRWTTSAMARSICAPFPYREVNWRKGQSKRNNNGTVREGHYLRWMEKKVFISVSLPIVDHFDACVLSIFLPFSSFSSLLSSSSSQKMRMWKERKSQ